MNRDYVVLQSKTPHHRRGGPEVMATSTDDTSGLEAVEISEASLSDTERADIERDPQTKAIAAAMPMALIEPVGEADAGPTDSDTTTWGVDAVKATQSPFDGSGITVAVLDTGIKPNVPAFKDMDIVQRNFTSAGPDDTHGHGTHCAGTIFGRDTDGTRIGVAPGVKRAVIGKVLGPGGGSSAGLVQAIQWAVNEGAHVISMSLGIDFPGFVDQLVKQNGMNLRAATSLALAEYRHNINLFGAVGDMLRAQAAFTQGTIIVAASGNESERPNFTIAVAPPAAGVEIMAIGALADTAGGFSVAGFSNTEVDVSAPGVNVVSASLDGGLTSKSGTSMATPHVAGVAALWAQRMVTLSSTVNPAGLKAQVFASADRATLAPGFLVDDVGSGMVQAPLS